MEAPGRERKADRHACRGDACGRSRSEGPESQESNCLAGPAVDRRFTQSDGARYIPSAVGAHAESGRTRINRCADSGSESEAAANDWAETSRREVKSRPGRILRSKSRGLYHRRLVSQACAIVS